MSKIYKVMLYMIPMFGIIYSIAVILKMIVRGIKSGRSV